MLHSNVARPYAEALFNLARPKKSEEEWLAILANLSQIVNCQEFSLLVNNPKIDVTAQVELVKSILKDEVNTNVVNLLKLLAENNRLMVIPDIYSIFKALVLEDQQRAYATIEAPYAINQQQQQNFESLLSNKFGKKVTVQATINPELIAGVKITIDDKVIDSSIKGRLANLATQLTAE